VAQSQYPALDPNFFSPSSLTTDAGAQFLAQAGAGYANYIVASIGGAASTPVWFLGGSYSTSFLWNPDTSVVLQYTTLSAGLGLGLSLTGGLQTGAVGLNSPSDYTGLGIQASAVAAWDGGIAFTAQGGSGNIGVPGGAKYSGVMTGPVAGAGASVNGEFTYTWFVGSMNFSNAPQNVQTAFCKAIGGC
jgi:hypothetical protein